MLGSGPENEIFLINAYGVYDKNIIFWSKFRFRVFHYVYARTTGQNGMGHKAQVFFSSLLGMSSAGGVFLKDEMKKTKM